MSQSEVDDFDLFPTQRESVEWSTESLRAIRAELQAHGSSSTSVPVRESKVSPHNENGSGISDVSDNGNVLTRRRPAADASTPSPALLSLPPRIKTTSVRERKRIGKHLSFRERPDWLKSRYFLFTAPYGLFFLIGAALGFARKRNIFCLVISGAVGLLFLAFGIIHAIDYYNGAPLESLYVAVPFVLSMFFCILMACFYAIGSVFKTSLLISIVCGIATIFYGYALLKDYSDGSYYRDNVFVRAAHQDDLASLLGKSKHDDERENDASLELLDTPPSVLARNDRSTTARSSESHVRTNSSRYQAFMQKGTKFNK